MLCAGVLALVLSGAAPASSQDLAEPQTSVRFPVTAEGRTLLGLSFDHRAILLLRCSPYRAHRARGLLTVAQTRTFWVRSWPWWVQAPV
jgi:hypothetical protein